jgi:hypothetical protein
MSPTFCRKCRGVFFSVCAGCGAAVGHHAEEGQQAPMVRYDMDHGQDPEGPVWPVQTRPVTEIRSLSAMPFNNSAAFSDPPKRPRFDMPNQTSPNLVIFMQNSGDTVSLG